MALGTSGRYISAAPSSPIMEAFPPSPNQQNIFETFFGLAPGQTLMVNAVAGSGKSTTLEMLLRRMPQDMQAETIVVAFNKDIATAMLNRLAKVNRLITVKTIHALGLAAVRNFFGRGWNPEITGESGNKYKTLIETHFRRRGRFYNDRPEARDIEEMQALYKLVHFARVTLTDPTDSAAVLSMADQREIDLPFSEETTRFLLEALPIVLEWGARGMDKPFEDGSKMGPDEVIDYTDMLWLPYRLGIPVQQFRVVLTDEAQDLSALQLWVVMSACKPTGLKVFVGDPRQAIYAFTGADAHSYDNIAEATNAVQCPLDVCYRCPKEVIRLAQIIVPNIQWAPDAPEGVVQPIAEKTFDELVTNKDMVLCRTNAPLIENCFRLIRRGKRAKVRGRNIGEQILKTIDAVEKVEGFEWDSFYLHANTYRTIQLRRALLKKDSEQLCLRINDQVDSAIALYEGAVDAGATNMGDLRDHVTRLFTDDEDGSILLSSIHKAKGLEADRVFLLRPDLLPHPMAKTEAGLEQEYNLKYVCYTRAMRELYIVEGAPSGG